MTAAELVRQLSERGIALECRGENVRVRSPHRLADGDRALIREHKAELLVLLRPQWDQAEADRLLAELHQAADGIRTAEFGGTWPPDLGAVVPDLLAIAQDHIDRHAEEAARGWDALELLRGVKTTLLRAVGNWKKQHRSRK